MIEPLRDMVLIERLPEPSKIGRIIVPDIAKEASLKGKVLAVGPGKREDGSVSRIPLQVKPGDMVYFNSKWNDLSESHYDPDKPAHYDARLHLILEGDIIGIMGD
jgi:chaperonin GroES